MNNIEDQIQWFNCLGEINIKDNKLGNVCSKNNAYKQLLEQGMWLYPCDIMLFGRRYNSDAVLLLNELDIFCRCRKNYLCIYQGAMNTNFRIFGARAIDTKNRNYCHLRKEISIFMTFICNYLANRWDENSAEICNKILLSTSKCLSSFWALQKNMSDLPDSVIYSGSIPGNKSLHASFHLLHLHLDLAWYRCLLMCRLEQLITRFDLSDVPFDVYEEKNQYIRSLIHDLFIVAIKRFEKLSLNELKRKTPFPCYCFKEIWLLLQIFLEKQNKSSLQSEFWTYINNYCSSLIYADAKDEINEKANKIVCSNPVLFSLWILSYLGQLYSYSEEGDYIGSFCERMVSNYMMLEKILKSLLSANVVSEAQLRSCIPFVSDLMDLWPPQRDPICMLWDYFHHRLNGCFFLAGAGADSVAINCATGAEILQQITNIVDLPMNSGVRPGNSYHLFLRLFGMFLHKNPQQWPSIKGRIFSKFSLAKMQALKEMGILNFSSLFLCMALTGPSKEVGDKMQELLNQATTVSLDINRRLMIWKSHLALLQLYIIKDIDIAEGSRLLMQDVNRISSCKDPDSVTLFNTLAKGLKDIIATSKTLDYSEYALIGSWIHSYLKISVEPTFLIHTLKELMTKILSLSKSVGMIEYNASKSEVTKMYLTICKHLLPFIKEKFASSVTSYFSQVVDLAVNITLLALNRTNVGVVGTSVLHLFESFTVNANPVNSTLSIKYLCNLLQEEGILAELMDSSSNYEVLIIQTWIRSSIYAFEETSHKESMRLTHIVCQLPSFTALCKETSLDIKCQTRPVDSFICVVGELYLKQNSLEESSKFREQCSIYLTPMVKSFERMLRNKDVKERILCRMYEVAAILLLHCGPIIYSKTQPYCIFNTLVNSLLLPVGMFKPGVDMPSSMLYAIRRTFPMLMKGIVKLNKTSGNSLSSTIKNLIIRYFPRLVGKSLTNVQECSKESNLHRHPLLLCFQDDSRMFLETISQSFLKVGDAQCMNGLMFLLELFQENKYDENVLKLFIDISLTHVLEIIVLSDSTMLVKRQAIVLLKQAIHNEIKTNRSLRERFWAVLKATIKKYVIFHSVNIVSLLCKMCEIAPDMMRDVLPEIREMINSPSIFHRSNVVKTMRLGVENMEKLLNLTNQ